MILRNLFYWGIKGRTGGCWGVLGPPHPPPSPPRSVSSWCVRSRGVSGVASEGRRWCLSSALTWRRRKRRKEVLILSPSCHNYCWDLTQRGGVVEVRDDEVQQVVVVERRSDGEFYDTHHHHHHNITQGDIGVKVNVGEPVICELHRLFHIPRESALKMVRSDAFLLVSDTAILQTLYFLKEHQVCPKQLQRVPWLLLQQPDTLYQKFQKLQEPHLFLTLPDGLGFSRFTTSQITKYQRNFAKEAPTFPNHPNRVYYLAERLEVPVAVVSEKLVKPKQVLTMDINRINNIIDIFHRYGVHMRDVVSDMWVFYHNIHVTEERLRLAVEAGCVHPKPWICHSSGPVFERYMERLRARQQVLGEDGDLAAYISKRLECPVHEIHAAFRRNPSLRRVHVSHVKSKLDLLLSEGFRPEDVRDCMRVLQYAEDRTRKRIQEMKRLGEFPFPISFLYKQPKTFYNIVQRIKRTRKEDEKEEERVKQEEVTEKDKEDEIKERRGGGGKETRKKEEEEKEEVMEKNKKR